MSALSESTRAVWRDALGASCRLWEGPLGRHLSEPGLAFAFSGEPALDFNIAICHAAGAEAIERALAEVKATASPGLIMLAGPALGEARRLTDEGWVPIHSAPFRSQTIAPNDGDPSVRRLDRTGLEAFRSVVEESFRATPSLTRLALPDSVALGAPDADPAFASWGLYEAGALVSAVATVVVNDNVCVWMMATRPAVQGHGYGRRLLSAVLGHCARAGARRALLLATPSGDPLYQSMGFDIIEYWQAWSRPRWVLA
jgi:GNAT superfamily N-acetyltransferase